MNTKRLFSTLVNTGIRSMILAQVVRMIAIGGFVGLGLGALGGWAAQSQLYEIKGYDPLVLTGSAVVLVIVALVAGFIPAYRASRVDPMGALRYE